MTRLSLMLLLLLLRGFFIRAVTARSNPPTLLFLFSPFFLNRANPPLWLRLAPLSVRGFLLFTPRCGRSVAPQRAKQQQQQPGRKTDRQREREEKGGGIEEGEEEEEREGGAECGTDAAEKERGGRKQRWGGDAGGTERQCAGASLSPSLHPPSLPAAAASPQPPSSPPPCFLPIFSSPPSPLPLSLYFTSGSLALSLSPSPSAAAAAGRCVCVSGE